MASVNDVSKNIEILSKFTMFNEEEIDFSIIDIIDENYSIQIDDKKYLFKILSDMDGLISFDKEILWANYCEIVKKDYFYNYCFY